MVFITREWSRIMTRCLPCFIVTLMFGCCGTALGEELGWIDADSNRVLQVPSLSQGEPRAGKRVAVTPVEYAGTDVFHTVYLPNDWQEDGPALPIIFEYTGNYFPQSGSTGEPEDGALGYCLTGGRYIWVSLPYISNDGMDNQVKWWGNEEATVAYAKRNVPRVMKAFNADSNAVFLCGFSRGAIGVNYLGLHDDEIASLWTGFISHDHFDGVRSWQGTTWGAPLKQYRAQASERLQRVGSRPYLVSQNGNTDASEAFVQSVLPETGNFTFQSISAGEIFGTFPNEWAKSAHTDRWPIKPSPYRISTWQWMNAAADAGRVRDRDKPQ